MRTFTIFMMGDMKVIPLDEVNTLIREYEEDIKVLERAELILTNREDILPAAQEASHYNWLDDKIREVEQHNMNLQDENKKLREALNMAVEAGEFFSKYADCTKDSWACSCSFCKDTTQSRNLRKARQVLKVVGEE